MAMGVWGATSSTHTTHIDVEVMLHAIALEVLRHTIALEMTLPGVVKMITTLPDALPAAVRLAAGCAPAPAALGRLRTREEALREMGEEALHEMQGQRGRERALRKREHAAHGNGNEYAQQEGTPYTDAVGPAGYQGHPAEYTHPHPQRAREEYTEDARQAQPHVMYTSPHAASMYPPPAEETYAAYDARGHLLQPQPHTTYVGVEEHAQYGGELDMDMEMPPVPAMQQPHYGEQYAENKAQYRPHAHGQPHSQPHALPLPPHDAQQQHHAHPAQQRGRGCRSRSTGRTKSRSTRGRKSWRAGTRSAGSTPPGAGPRGATRHRRASSYSGTRVVLQPS
ncbi:hypothetical protein B0H11DRAFT_2273712 [Mycena galericulata]|nr:hypothetical protein B0H11DRAFT_2273712 [Mycena galericulata]